MIRFILNNDYVESSFPKGMTVLDFVRYHKNLKGTKIGCREGDCGACVVMVGEIHDGKMRYRTQTSCLMPLANAMGKHIVTIEGVNAPNGELTPVQKSLLDESGTQCGFCTVGFVMSLTCFCLDENQSGGVEAVSAIDGNICRCTGYGAIERAAQNLAKGGENGIDSAIKRGIVPQDFASVIDRLKQIKKPEVSTSEAGFLAGGTDLYVQAHEAMVSAEPRNLFNSDQLKFIKEIDGVIEIGGANVVSDLMESEIFRRIFTNLNVHLKLVSSTPIRNMATIAGNFVNASPIGDMTAWFLALDAEITLRDDNLNEFRELALRDLYLGYKTLAKSDNEYVSAIRFRNNFTHFNFEKVSKRQFLDIASVNTAISLRVNKTDNVIEHANISAGGVSPIPLFLAKTSKYLAGKLINKQTIEDSASLIDEEIAPISDVRGSEKYKRLLLGELYRAHFYELFGI